MTLASGMTKQPGQTRVILATAQLDYDPGSNTLRILRRFCRGCHAIWESSELRAQADLATRRERLVTCTAVPVRPLQTGRAKSPWVEVHRKVATACPGWSLLDVALKPAAPRLLRGLTAPTGNDLGLWCRE
jgi:hypothetical protein